MKIEQSAVMMNATHEYSSEWEVSVASETRFQKIIEGVSANENVRDEARLRLQLEALIARLLALISGGEIEPSEAVQPAGLAAEPGSRGPARAVRMEWTSESTETFREHERSDFSSTGIIKTADGRSLDFKLDLALCRDFSCERKSLVVSSVVLRDPLVINFDGKAAELTGQRFAFDLDADGKDEAISELGLSSGFLAIDRNADGRINNGNELFGVHSGNGFSDLAALDGDGNGWIDEADGEFNTLRIWQHNASGEDQLRSLAERGVGALYLGAVDTPFALNDAGNRMLAQIRASGVYLSEDGRAGTLQQVDLATESANIRTGNVPIA